MTSEADGFEDLYALVRGLLDAALLVAPDGRTVLRANERLARDLRRTSTDLAGTDWRDAFPGEEVAALEPRMLQALRERRKLIFDLELRGAPIEHHIHPIVRDDGLLRAILWTGRDMSRLRRGEARMNEAQRIARIGSWELDLDTEKLTWSDEIYRMFELDRSTFRASYEAFLEIVHPEDREALNKAYRESLASRTPYSFVHRLRMGDGRLKWVHERGETRYAEDGTARRTVGTVQDITEQVGLENELRRARDLLRAVVDSSPDPIYVKDLDNRFVVANTSYARSQGIEPEHLLGRRDAMSAEDQTVFAGRTVHDPNDVRKRADGSQRHYDTFKLPLLDAEGHVYGLLGYSRDLTEWMQARKMVLESDATFRSLVDGMPDAVLVNEAEVYVYANEAAARMLGYEAPEDLVGRRPDDIVAPEDLPAVAAALSKPDEPVPSVNRRYVRRDGSRVNVEVHIQPTTFRGRNVRMVVARDVTARNELNARMARMDRIIAVGTLAAGVGHEINNPLAYVSANLEFAATELARAQEQLHGAASTTAPLVAEVQEALREAREGADRVKIIVRELKSFSRVEEPEQGPLEITRVLDSAIQMAMNEIRHRALLVKDYAAAPLVVANEARLGQVFLNLVVNAAQAIPEGRADQNQVRVATRTDERGHAVIEVSDTGTGIEPATLKQIFDPFFTTKPVGQGTGLGLSICQNIVQSLGGELTVETEVGRGSTFRVVLPGSRPSVAAETAPPASTADRPADVLVVDDEPLVGKALRRLLEPDHHVTVTTRGVDALERLARGEQFDVVLCDLMMPEMTGMDLHRALSDRYPELARRMIFITGGAFTPMAREFLETVPNPRVEKPFDRRLLRTLVQGMVR